mmetsp:Transcript_10072/g.12430  ORF Transcript_10072/g.12430 Transcript_10072/m.12430 type:complete len:584 (+) Transcript_10072:56-1807(+)
MNIFLQKGHPGLVELSQRSTVSPLPKPAAKYVVLQGGMNSSSCKMKNDENEDSIPVTFQSISNARYWWKESTPSLGIAIRYMNRNAKFSTIRGRIYSLIQKVTDENTTTSKRAKYTSKKEGYHAQALGISIVHTWVEDEIEEPCTYIPTPMASSAASSIVQEEALHQNKRNITSTMEIDGDLFVRGTIYGKIQSKPLEADYAEWFPIGKDENGKEEFLLPGSVVRLNPETSSLTLNTNGLGPILITSTNPAIAAGVPQDLEESGCNKGALVAFVGQVPVRCSGIVKPGDQLIPSGQCDGRAISLNTLKKTSIDNIEQRPNSLNLGHSRVDHLGIALQGNLEQNKNDDSQVLCFVRWNHAVRRECGDEIDRVVNDATLQFYKAFIDAIRLAAFLLLLIEGALLAYCVFILFREELTSTPIRSQSFDYITSIAGCTNAILIFIFFNGIFSTKNAKYYRYFKFFLIFWFGYILLALAFATIGESPFDKKEPKTRSGQLRFLLSYISWKIFTVIYNLHILQTFSYLRKNSHKIISGADSGVLNSAVSTALNIQNQRKGSSFGSLFFARRRLRTDVEFGDQNNTEQQV